LAAFGFLRRNRHERAGYALYCAAVAAAREPALYATVGVPDSVDGRFDLIGLHVFLLIRRLTRLPDPGAALAQAVFDAMFSDMDRNLREMGVSDLAVGKRVRAMWEAFHGRAQAYDAALDANDSNALAAAIGRNVWRGEPAPPDGTETLARVALAHAAYLADQPVADFAAGKVQFPPAAEAAQ
jgi:cytochrome b pre-mRNA-processing protein 3